MSSTLYDVLIKVPRYGIHNKVNFHSFQAVLFTLIPFKCKACGESIFPLSRVVWCLRCYSYCHRHCMYNESFRCPKVDDCFACDCNAAEAGTSSMPIECKSSTVRASKSRNKVFIRKVQDIPEPGTGTCFWQTTLRDILGDGRGLCSAIALAPRLIPRATPESATGCGLNKDWDLLVRSLLSDGSSLPGLTCSKLHAIFMDLTFRDCNACFLNARRCLDCISCALLTTLPQRIISEHGLTFEIVNLVEQYVLGLSHKSMYLKLLSFATRHSRANFSLFIGKAALPTASIPFYSITIECERAIKQLAMALTATDKLKALVEVLHSVSMQTNNNNGDYDNRSKTSDIGADELVARVMVLIRSSYRNIDTPDISWEAECTYIDKLSRGEDWRLGVEGYALTTFMQALHTFS